MLNFSIIFFKFCFWVNRCLYNEFLDIWESFMTFSFNDFLQTFRSSISKIREYVVQNIKLYSILTLLLILHCHIVNKQFTGWRLNIKGYVFVFCTCLPFSFWWFLYRDLMVLLERTTLGAEESHSVD